MTRETLLGWLEALLFVAASIAIPWAMGYLALALGAMG